MSARIRLARWLRSIADRLYHNRAIHVAVSYDEDHVVRFYVFGVLRAEATIKDTPFTVEAWADHSGYPAIAKYPAAADAVQISTPRLEIVP